MSRLLETKIQDSLDNFKIMYELMGKSADEIQKLIAEEKQKQLEYYAYTIMNDENMTTKEKKEKIFQYFREGHLQMKVRFSKAGRCPLLWPVLWPITFFCFLKNTYTLRNTTFRETLQRFKESNQKTQLIRIFENSDS